MDRSELLDRLTADVLTYVMHGDISEDVVASGIKPTGLDERFEEYRLLVDLHFILRDDVVSFVRSLPEHLREIQTSTHTRSRTTRGTVQGRVNWQRTIQRRHHESPGDRSLFVCDTRTENYDTDENLVLKQLLSVVYSTVERAEEYLARDYAWTNDSWRGEENLVDELRGVVERNVHVRRIREPGQYEPTDRMLASAANSRKDIYRDAARLVRAHRAIRAGEPDALRELLDETAITPDDDETLLELFVLFRFVAALEELRDGSFDLETITSGRQEVARLSGEKEIALYHDNSAANRGLSFVSVPEGKADEELSRTEAVQRTARRVASDYFRNEGFENHTGRPDVIVLEVHDEDAGEYEYLIIEVKNSTRTKTVRQGIKETLEYLAFLRLDDGFVFGSEEFDDPADAFGDGWNGLLVVQDLADETRPFEDQRTMKILQASEVEERLPSVLEAVLTD
jgi:hypothetical protein